MKNLLDCHCIGVHSFPLQYENGLYRRVFYADRYHGLHDDNAIAIHPHHVDLKITVVKGTLCNRNYVVSDERGSELFGKYKWESHISGSAGKFVKLGTERLVMSEFGAYSEGCSFNLRSDQLHTVYVPSNTICAWLVEEFPASAPYDAINYSKMDLELWSPKGLYTECNDVVKASYLRNIENRHLYGINV
jgi:hypothetical protein